MSTHGIVPPTTTSPVSNVIFTGSDGTADGIVEAINSTISAFGFAQGGTLTIRAPTIQIGGTAPADQTAPSDPGIFYLPDSFFAGNAFGAYNFSSAVRGITVASDTTLTLQQRNFAPTSTSSAACRPVPKCRASDRPARYSTRFVRR